MKDCSYVLSARKLESLQNLFLGLLCIILISATYITQREIELNPKNEQEKRLQVLYARVWDFEPFNGKFSESFQGIRVR